MTFHYWLKESERLSTGVTLTVKIQAVKLFSAILLLTGLTITTLAQAGRDEIAYFHNDHLGSAITAINEDGDVCWRQIHTPCGE